MAPDLPHTMRSVHQPSKFSAKLAQVETPLPVPTDPADILIKVHATAPCAGELWWARDYAALFPPDKEPVPCSDLAGTVIRVPVGVRDFAVGDAVFARVDAARPGCLREYTLARVSELSLMPRNLTFAEAAAVPLSALTAWQGLFTHGGVDGRAITATGEEEADARRHNRVKRLLVTGATGGVGSWVVQLAALAGVGAVVAVCGPSKADMARELGATEVLDYRKTSISAWAAEAPGRECDLVIDCVGGDTLVQCWNAARDGGVLLSIAGNPLDSKPEGLNKTLAESNWFLVKPLGSNLAQVAELLRAGKVRPALDSVWEFDEFEKAFEKLDTGHAQGKIVIKVDELAETRPDQGAAVAV